MYLLTQVEVCQRQISHEWLLSSHKAHIIPAAAHPTPHTVFSSALGDQLLLNIHLNHSIALHSRVHTDISQSEIGPSPSCDKVNANLKHKWTESITNHFGSSAFSNANTYTVYIFNS